MTDGREVGGGEWGVSSASRTARFSTAVAARYPRAVGDVRTGARITSVARVLQRLTRATAPASLTRVTFAPRISLRLASLGGSPDDASRGSRRIVSPVPQDLPKTVSSASRHGMVERSRARSERDDTYVAGAEGAGRSRRVHVGRGAAFVERTGTDLATPPVPRVLRRRAPAPSAVPAAPVRDDWPPRSAAPQPSRPAPLSPVEMNRLTDHIVLTIDRRIAAFRERQGRV